MSIEFLKIMAWRNYLAAHPNVFEACKFYDMDKIVKRIAARPHNEINYLLNLLQQQSDTLTRYPPFLLLLLVLLVLVLALIFWMTFGF